MALLAACQQAGAPPAAQSRACTAPPSTAEGMLQAGASGQSLAARDCVHRWAYRLAAAPDDARLVVQAVLGSCSNEIDMAVMEITPGQSDVEAERREMQTYFERQAMTYVIQGRAGHCPEPPAPGNSAAPAGAPAANSTNAR